MSDLGQPGILALWSAPRSRSTAFEAMFAARGDYRMLHEPFSHVINFGESRVGDRVARSEDELIPALLELAADGPLFFKDTTDFHYPRLLADRAFLAGPAQHLPDPAPGRGDRLALRAASRASAGRDRLRLAGRALRCRGGGERPAPGRDRL